MSQTTHPVDERISLGKLTTLGLQHVLVMYAGAIAVPLIIGRALNLSPSDVAFLISADLFCCGLITIIQSLGATQWFGIKLPVMMGVTFASVGPMVAIANNNPGTTGAQLIFGSIIGAGIVSIIIAPIMSRLLRFFPPVVTGTIIAIIGISLMKIGINWIFGNPVGPTAPKIIDPNFQTWFTQITGYAKEAGLPGVPEGFKIVATMQNPDYASIRNIGIAGAVLLCILLIVRFAEGFMANIAVLAGIIVGAIIASAIGIMHFDKVSDAAWFGTITPFHFGMPIFDPILILTMSLVMVVVMIESTGMFLALGEMTGKEVTQKDLSRGLRTDGLGTLIGGIFNTFPYTSFSQNIGLVAVTGVRSRFVCVAGGVILLTLGLVPKMAALVESLPTIVLGGAGIVMFGMVASTGIRILSNVDFVNNKFNALIVAISIGFGMIPLIAPDFKMWLPHSIHPLIESGILLGSIVAVTLNLFFNGAKASTEEIINAAKHSEA